MAGPPHLEHVGWHSTLSNTLHIMAPSSSLEYSSLQEEQVSNEEQVAQLGEHL
jgi:hypothetical protein